MKDQYSHADGSRECRPVERCPELRCPRCDSEVFERTGGGWGCSDCSWIGRWPAYKLPEPPAFSVTAQEVPSNGGPVIRSVELSVGDKFQIAGGVPGWPGDLRWRVIGFTPCGIKIEMCGG